MAEEKSIEVRKAKENAIGLIMCIEVCFWVNPRNLIAGMKLSMLELRIPLLLQEDLLEHSPSCFASF